MKSKNQIKSNYVWSWGCHEGVFTYNATSLQEIIEEVMEIHLSQRNNEDSLTVFYDRSKFTIEYINEDDEQISTVINANPSSVAEYLDRFCNSIDVDEYFDICEYVNKDAKSEYEIDRTESLFEQSVGYLQSKIGFLAEEAFINAGNAIFEDTNFSSFIEQLLYELHINCSEAVASRVLGISIENYNGGKDIFSSEVQHLINEREKRTNGLPT